MSDDEPTLHPLEILALQELPWEVRVKRIAAMAIRQKFGWLPNKLLARHMTRVIDQLREPWGKKGQLRKELKAEIYRQRKIRWSRKQHARHSCSLDDYSVEFALYYGWEKEIRCRALAQKRLGTSYRPLDRRIKWYRSRIPAWNIQDAKVSRGLTLAVLEPSCVHNGHCFVYNEKHHKVRYLLFKVGDVGGNVRISIECQTVEQAINWLKRTSVLTAEKKSYAVRIDFVNKCFHVKSPRRKSWREIPFKSATRKKKCRR